MTDIEQRLRRELQKVTELADPASVRPLRDPPPRRATLARWLAPVAVVAAVTGVIAGLNLAGQTSGQPRPHRSAPPVSRLNSGTVTIVDGLRLSRILPILAGRTGIPLAQFQHAAADTRALDLPPYANGKLEGFLYPDTYHVTPGETALQILQKAVAEFKTKVAPLHLTSPAANQQGYTPLQIITGASLLEGAVGPQYFAKVARVIDNRISQRLDLELDSTVAYATGTSTYRLTSRDLAFSSPYNTFLHTGLPPGPIDSPDIQAITAFLHPAPDTNTWIYFVVVDKKGTTLFTSDFAVFQTYVAEARRNGVG